MKRPPISLKAQALALLARREHSRAELRNKLLAHARKLALADAQAQALQVGVRTCARAGAEVGEVAGDVGDAAELRETLLAEVEAVLDWLQAQHFQSDQRFVESRIHARSTSHGPARIRQELARHKLALPPETAQALRETELERARQLWQKRYGAAAEDPREKARQGRFLCARGFSPEVVRKVLGSAGEEF